jgi:hypothetical protein
MGGGLMQLVAYGAQDIYLTGNPQITFFKVVYRRHTNFSMEAIQQTWNGGAATGRATATISRNGDLVHRMYFQIDMGTTSASFTTHNPGAAWITDVSVEIGGQTIDKHYGKWLETWAELTEPNVQGMVAGNVNSGSYVDDGDDDDDVNPLNSQGFHNTLFQRMSLMGGVNAVSIRGGSTTNENLLLDQGNFINSGRYAYVPLQFWFCKNPGLALPLIALQYHEVKIILNHTLSAVFSKPLVGASLASQNLWADYIYLDTDERRRFAQVSHEYLIEQVQHQQGTGSSMDLNFNHPVKELIWTGPWSNGAHGSVGDIQQNGTFLLKLNGHDRFSARPISYFTQTQVHENHTGPGGLRIIDLISIDPLLNGSAVNNFDDSIAVYSFALKPEEHQPSGTCNFSRIDNAQLIRTPGGDWNVTELAPLDIYAVNYNVLRIMSGMGGLAYSN